MGIAIASFLSCKKDESQTPFEGEVLMKTTSAGKEANVRVLVRAEKIRFEMSSPEGQPMNGLFDPASNKVTMLLDAQHAYMDMNFSKPSAVPNTDPATSKVEKLGSEEIAGRTCENYRVTDGPKKSEVCVTSGIAFFDLSSLRNGGGEPVGLAKEFKDKRSFPLRSIEYDATGKEISRMVVTKIERKPADPKLFEIPADYKKYEMPALR